MRTATETATTPFSIIQLRVTLTGGELTRVETLELSGDNARTEAINARAEPILREEALKAGSADDRRRQRRDLHEPQLSQVAAGGHRPGPGAWLTARTRREVMGIPVGIDVRDDGVDPAALDRAFDWLRWVDATFSTYRAESEISRLDAGTLAPERRRARGPRGARALRGAARRAPAAASTSARRGALDPSAFVKGWAVETAASMLVGDGARNLCVHAGGDVRVRGERAPGRPWRVGIQHPYRRDRTAAVLHARDLAVATSGAYERGAHIVDPRTGEPPEGVLSVTVLGPDLGTADAYATAAFAMGVDGPAWTAGLGDYEALTILSDGRVLSTRGVPDVE